MNEPRYDVIAIGNAIVDVMAPCDDELIEELQLNRGGMTLVDTERAKELYDAMGPAREISGGSAANTLAGLAALGAQCAFIGQVADDQLGEVFAHDIHAVGIDFDTAPRAAPRDPTGSLRGRGCWRRRSLPRSAPRRGGTARRRGRCSSSAARRE